MDSQDNGGPLQEVCIDIIENLHNGVPCINKEALPRLVRATQGLQCGNESWGFNVVIQSQ